MFCSPPLILTDTVHSRGGLNIRNSSEYNGLGLHTIMKHLHFCRVYICHMNYFELNSVKMHFTGLN